MKSAMRVAAYQMAVGTNIAANEGGIRAAIDRAAENGAEILLTPEGALSGYTHTFEQEAVTTALKRITLHAVQRRIGLALGICFVEGNGRCYNQLRFYRPDGKYLGFHGKQLRCGTVIGRAEGEIQHFVSSRLRVFPWKDGIVIGGLICNDLWANPECTPMPDPHLTQRLAAMGAQIIFHAVNGGRNGSAWSRVTWQYHESNLRMRARAARLWMVTADNCHPTNIPCSAPSGVISPSGEWVARAKRQGEQLVIHSVEFTRSGQHPHAADAGKPRR